MPSVRKLSDEEVRLLLAWAQQRQSIPTRKQIAAQLGISEPTVARIVRAGGYTHRNDSADISALLSSRSDTKENVSRETIRNGSLRPEEQI